MAFFDPNKISLLFDTQQIVDAEADIVQYSITRKDITFSVYISPHEAKAFLTLKQAGIQKPLVDIGLHNLALITTDNTHLYFFKKKKKNDAPPFLTVQLQPTIAILFEA